MICNIVVVLDRSPIYRSDKFSVRIDQLNRINLGLTLLNGLGDASALVLCGKGWHFRRGTLSHAQINLCEVRKISRCRIYLEEWSMDTQGNIAFTMLGALRTFESGFKIHYVSSDYHVNRVRKISIFFAKNLGKIPFEVHGCTNPSDTITQKLIQEEYKSSSLFDSRSMEFYWDKNLENTYNLQRFFDNHRLYNKSYVYEAAKSLMKIGFELCEF